MNEHQPEVVRDRDLDVWQRIDGEYRSCQGGVVATFAQLEALFGPLQEPDWRDL